MSKPPVYHDFIEACAGTSCPAQSGCPLCRLVGVAVQAALRVMLHDDNLLNPKTRDQLHQSLGFCREHTWLLLETQIGNALGISILYEDLLKQVQKGLSQAAEALEGQRSVRLKWARPGADKLSLEQQALRPERPCPACHAQESIERQALDMLSASLNEPDLVQALRSSGGLCLPHLDQAFARLSRTADRQLLLEISQQHLQSLREELLEFIRKNDYRFHHEKIGKEGNAWKRAMGIAVGEKRDGKL
ncbi:MAG: DUF6062 family protein [Chloroflexota bacterium]